MGALHIATSPLAEAVSAIVHDGAQRLVENEDGIRADTDVEHVHHARVGARRLRSNLATFQPLMDADWRSTVRGELSWMGSLLGAVRDADVLGAWLDHQGGTLDAGDQPGLVVVALRLAGERRQSLRALLDALDGPRYGALTAALVDAAAGAPLAPAIAERPARTAEVAGAVAPLVGREWRRLRRQIEGLGEHPDLGELHRARIRAKKLRYALEALVLVAPAAAADARPWARAVAELQDELGELHDTVSREDWLRRAGADPGAALVAGQLLERNRVRRAELLASWPVFWKRASKKRLRSALDASLR